MNFFVKIVAGILGLGGLWAIFKPKNSPEVDRSNLLPYNNKHKFDDLKSHSVGIIKKIIKRESVEGFKIGKTGQPDERTGANDYENYEKMYLLCQSKSRDTISRLESVLNDIFFDDLKNQNQKKGSAGTMVSRDGFYYVYVIIF